jgi:hypothetical protein
MRIRAVLWAVVAVGVAVAAHADTINFTIAGADTGSIAITESAGLITNIAGTFDGSNISGLLPLFSIGNNDNDLFTSQPYLDNDGVSFSLAMPDSYSYSYVNFYWDGGSTSYASIQNTTDAGSGAQDVGPDTLTVTTGGSAPEPGSFLLMGLGLAGALALHTLRSRIVRGGYDLHKSGSHRSCAAAGRAGDASGTGSR